MSNPICIIASLEITDGRVVQGANFTELIDAGNPVEMASLYAKEGADEIVFLDTFNSDESWQTTLDFVRKTAEFVALPFTVGGAISTLDEVSDLLGAGAEKVVINAVSRARPELFAEITDRFGSQVLVLSVDVRRARTVSGFEVMASGDTTSVDALTWIEKACALGAGEILLNSMDLSGTRAGYDLGMITAVRAITEVPLIASGGEGTLEDFAAAIDAGADALLAASVFHLGIHRIGDVKKYLNGHDYSVRYSART